MPGEAGEVGLVRGPYASPLGHFKGVVVTYFSSLHVQPGDLPPPRSACAPQPLAPSQDTKPN